MGFSTIIIYFVSWPYLYENPGRILLHIQYIASQGGRTGILKWSLSPLLQVITTMPEVMLIFLLIGLYFITRQLLNKRSAGIATVACLVDHTHFADFPSLECLISMEYAIF